MTRLWAAGLGIAKHPLFWLLAAFAAVWATLRRVNLLVANFSPDAVSYELLAEAETLREALSSVRTIGYPLFLRALGGISPEYQAAPTAHLAIYFAVLVAFWWSVRRYTDSPWLAFAWTLPLAHPCNLWFIKYVQPDFLGPAVAIAAVASLILLVDRPGPLGWTALTALTFCAYQMRPDNLFLVALLPCAGIVLLLCRRTFAPSALLRFAAGLGVAVVVPLLLFMTLRWSVVGQFGVVPFGGYNLIGVTASFLDRDLVDELPQEHRQLAGRILEAREARKLRPLRADSWTDQWFRQYSPNVWHVAEPIARELLTEAGTTRIDGVDVPPLSGEPVFTINRAFKELSRAIIVRRPLVYSKWVHDGFGAGRAMLFECKEFGALILLLALSVPFVIARAGRRSVADPASADRALRFLGLATVAVAYFAGRLLLTVLVNEPSPRFVLPAMVFLPGVLAASLFEVWRWVLRPSSRR